MIFRHPNGNHTYPKTDSLEYSLAFSHNSYSYPLTLLVPEPTSYRGCGHQRPATNLKRLLAGTRAHQLAAQVSLGLHQTARCLTSHPPPTATPALDRTTSRGPRGGYLASHPLCSADQRLTFNARPHMKLLSLIASLSAVSEAFQVQCMGAFAACRTRCRQR